MLNPLRRGIDFQPNIKLNGNTLDVTDQVRLVGFVLNHDLSWNSNTESLVNRAYQKMWILRRLKTMGATKKVMRLIYFQHIRSILEFGVAAWNSAITLNESKKLERVQKVALRLIYGRIFSYTALLKTAKLCKLSKRREKLCLEFAKKAAQHPKFKDWFKQVNVGQPKNRAKYAVTLSRLKRLEKSPIPYLTNLLNKNNGY